MPTDELTGTFEETMTLEQTQEATNLIDAGTYEGQIVKWEERVYKSTDTYENPLAGRRYFNCDVVLYSNDDPNQKRHLFVEFSPGAVVKVKSQKGGEYVPISIQNAAALYAATKLFGKPISEVLDYAVDNRLRYVVGVSKATEKYKAKNTLKDIKAALEE